MDWGAFGVFVGVARAKVDHPRKTGVAFEGLKAPVPLGCGVEKFLFDSGALPRVAHDRFKLLQEGQAPVCGVAQTQLFAVFLRRCMVHRR